MENLLHWHLDVNFLEDDVEIIDRTAFQNLSLMNKMALSILKIIAPLLKCSVKVAKKQVGWEKDNLLNTFRALDEDILTEAMLNVKL